jgi:cell division protein ZapA (FtsZ GTPase activity inhibitor)
LRESLSSFDEETVSGDIVTIELFGEKFRFRSESQVQEARNIADHLQNCVVQAEKQFKVKTSVRVKMAILLLAAMNISKEYFELKSEYSKLEGLVAERTESLLKKIDDGLA